MNGFSPQASRIAAELIRGSRERLDRLVQAGLIRPLGSPQAGPQRREVKQALGAAGLLDGQIAELLGQLGQLQKQAAGSVLAAPA